MATRALFRIAGLLGPAITLVGMSEEEVHGGEPGATVFSVAHQAP